MCVDQELLEITTEDIKAAARANDQEGIRSGFRRLIDVAENAQETMDMYFIPLPPDLLIGPNQAGKSD